MDSTVSGEHMDRESLVYVAPAVFKRIDLIFIASRIQMVCRGDISWVVSGDVYSVYADLADKKDHDMYSLTPEWQSMAGRKDPVEKEIGLFKSSRSIIGRSLR